MGTGLGFPDINTIEPLADALGVSVLEIMRSERIAETEITQDTASAALTDTFEFVKLQRKAERKSIFKIAGGVAACLFLIFLIDGIGLGFRLCNGVFSCYLPFKRYRAFDLRRMEKEKQAALLANFRFSCCYAANPGWSCCVPVPCGGFRACSCSKLNTVVKNL